MVLAVVKKLNIDALKSAASDLQIETKLLEMGDMDTLVAAMSEDASVLADVHNLLFQIHLTEGFLICPASGRRFPVKDGIPNMLLHEDEV